MFCYPAIFICRRWGAATQNIPWIASLQREKPGLATAASGGQVCSAERSGEDDFVAETSGIWRTGQGGEVGRDVIRFLFLKLIAGGWLHFVGIEDDWR